MPRLRAVVALAAVASCAIGAVTSGIFNQRIWDATGQQRFLLYTGLFALAAALIFAVRRSLLLPCFACGVALYAAVLTGAAPVLSVVYFALGCYGIGLLAFRKLRLAGRDELRPLWLDTVALVTGAGIWGFAVSFLAFARWNWPVVHGLLLAIPAMIAGRSIWNRSRAARRTRVAAGLNVSEYWAMALLLYVLGAHFLMSLKPEVSADGVAIHLTVPMHMAVHHFWPFDVTQFSWAVMPMTAEWCFTTVYLLGGEYAAKLLPFVFLCITCVLIVLLCRRVATPTLAMVIAAVYAATPVVQLISGAMFTDTIWAAFLLGAAVLILHWTEWRDAAALPASGILLGAAMATKLVALSFAAPCLAWVFFNCFGWKRRFDRKSMAALIVAGVLFVLVAAPPYATAMVKTGDPVFPYFNNIFRSPHYDTTPNWDDFRWKTRLTWHTPIDVTFHTSKFLESQNGALSLSWIVILVLLLFPPRGMFTRAVAAALSIGAIFFLLTWSRASYMRYLVPLFPLLLFVFAAYLGALRSKQPWLYRAVMGITVATVLVGTFLLPASGYWHKNFCLDPRNFKAEAAKYMEQMAPLRVMVDYLNRTAPGQPAAFFWVGAAGLEGRPYTSGSHTWDFFHECDEARSAQAVKQLMAKNGIRHFVTPLPSCGVPNLPQLEDFLKLYTREKFRGSCLYVAETKDGI